MVYSLATVASVILIRQITIVSRPYSAFRSSDSIAIAVRNQGRIEQRRVLVRQKDGSTNKGDGYTRMNIASAEDKSWLV